MTTNNEVNDVNAEVETDDDENEVDDTAKKVVKSDRRIAVDALLAAQALRDNRSVSAQMTFYVLRAEAMFTKSKINDFIATFDATYPKKNRSEWASKLAELDLAVSEAQTLGNATILKVTMAMRADAIKRHNASIKNQETAKKNREAKKSSEVKSTLVTSFDGDGMPIAI